jgi:GNAT superfamily N-acetyltransferase
MFMVSMSDVNITKAGVEDLPLIHDMAQVVFRHTYRDILSSRQMEYMMEWMYSLPNLHKQLSDGHVYYIAYTSGRPCGYMSIQKEGIDSGVMVFHLHKLYVMPSEQGKGVGTLLFKQAVAHVSGCFKPSRIELNVNRMNAAVEFYRHIGMRILREGDFHIGEGFYMNDYIMGADIV